MQNETTLDEEKKTNELVCLIILSLLGSVRSLSLSLCVSKASRSERPRDDDNDSERQDDDVGE